MRCYTITCESGAVVLVRAKSAAAANAAWDRYVARGEAEPRIRETTWPATPAEIKSCVASGHDYR